MPAPYDREDRVTRSRSLEGSDQQIHSGRGIVARKILYPRFGGACRGYPHSLDHSFAKLWTTCYPSSGPGGVSPSPSLRWLRCLRMDSPLRPTGMALWVMRSMMAAATVRSPRLSYHAATGSCEEMMSDRYSPDRPTLVIADRRCSPGSCWSRCVCETGRGGSGTTAWDCLACGPRYPRAAVGAGCES